MRPKAVLIIEDNHINMKLVRTLLQIGKYRIFEAVDAETGIEIAKEQRPDLILMDIQLPGIDGFEATSILKSSAETRDIPVVALTSYAMDGDKKKAQEAGCEGYICKPINTRTFIDKLTAFFRDAKTGGANDNR